MTLRALAGHEGHGAVADAARAVGIPRETMSRLLSGEDMPRAQRRVDDELARRARVRAVEGRGALGDGLTRTVLDGDLRDLLTALRTVDLPDDRMTGKAISAAHLAQIMLSGGDVECEIIRLIASYAADARRMMSSADEESARPGLTRSSRARI